MRDFSFKDARVKAQRVWKTNGAEGASVPIFFTGNAETLRQKECIRTVF